VVGRVIVFQNSDQQGEAPHVNIHIAESIARQAGAIARCDACQRHFVIAYDKRAEAQAYAMAMKAWQEGSPQNGSLEDVRRRVKSVLDNAYHRCPSCDRDSD
jgi:ribosomal protein L37AE/L43A